MKNNHVTTTFSYKKISKNITMVLKNTIYLRDSKYVYNIYKKDIFECKITYY